MSRVNQLMVTMERGAVTPYAHARIDTEDYSKGLHQCQNFLVTPYGGVTRLPGTLDAGMAGDHVTSAKARLMPFIFSQAEAYALEFSDSKIRFHTLAGVVESGGTPVEVAAPYLLADLWNIQITSIGDVIYITCEGHQARTLTRTSATSWTLALYDVEGGPWLPLPDPGTTLTPAGTGHAFPKMTGLTAPSGTVTSNPSHTDAWEIFDRTISTAAEPGTGGDGWIEYDYGAGVEKAIISYLLMAPQGGSSTDQMPTSWSIQGQEDGGSDWVILDVQDGLGTWVPGEVRVFEISNTTAYRKYRLYWRDSGTRDDGSAVIAGWEPLLHPDDQTAFNLTASSINGINDDTGFQTTDVGRLIRFMADDSLWRVLKIIARTSTTVVTVKVMGPAPLPASGAAAGNWQMQAWSETSGWPEKVFKYKGRMGLMSSTAQPRTGWLSVSADYDNFGTSQPLLDDDAITFTLTNGNIDDVLWATARREDLVIGTVGDIKVVGKRNPSEVFSPSNNDELDNLEVPPGAVMPVWIGTTMIFANQQTNRLHETGFSREEGGYVEAELTVLAEHLFRGRIKELHFQRMPLKTLWVVTQQNTLIACTYDKRQGIFAATSVVLPGSAAEVYSMCVLPGTDYDVPLLVTRRSVGGGWSHRIERMLDPFVSGGSSWEYPIYLMAATIYSGVDTATISGLDYLEGEDVAVYSFSGVDLGDATVTSGSVTVPGGGTVTEALVGLRYTSQIQTLRPPNVPEDGGWIYRKMTPISVAVDVLETYGLYAGGDTYTHQLTTEADRALSPAEPSLHTGMLEVPAEEGWDTEQKMTITTDRAYPATIRGVLVTFDRGS